MTNMAVTTVQATSTLASPDRRESTKSRPIPGIEKICSVTISPPARAPMSSAITVTSGMTAFRKAC